MYLFLRRKLADAFGNVGCDRIGGSPKLVLQVGASCWQALGNAICLNNEIETGLINIQLLELKVHVNIPFR